MNHFIDNARDHPLSSLKFVLIKQASTKTEEFLEQRGDTGKPSCGLMNLTVSMLRKNLTLEGDVNFSVDAAFFYHGRFPKVLDCTSGYQKGHVQQLSMGSKSFYSVI